MAEMLLTSPDQKKTLDDYDIILLSGMVMPITIDQSLGDQIAFTERCIMIKLSSKPSLTDPALRLPAEDITVFTQHVVSIQHRVREINELSVDKKKNWEKTMKEIVSTTVQ